MNKKVYILFLVIAASLFLSSCSTTKVQNTYETINFIINNNYGNEISNLKYNKNTNCSDISFSLKNNIYFEQKVITKFPSPENSIYIEAPTEELYVNDIVILLTTFCSNHLDKDDILSAIKASFNKKDNQVFEIGKGGTVQSLNGKLHVIVKNNY